MDAKTAVTLSAVAYADDVEAALGRALPTWRVFWHADRAVDDNMAFIARDPGGRYALAIRGTMMQLQVANVESWIEDLDVFSQVPWPTGDPQSKLSRGAHTGLTGLQSLVDSRSGTPLSMRDFLVGRAQQEYVDLTITGHSLGGTLATVFATWLHDEFERAGIDIAMSVWTFAAPAAGNASFASRYDQLFAETSFRFVMDFDVVPTFPVPSDMISMIRTYVEGTTPDEELRLADLALQGCCRGIEASELLHRSRYTQTNTPAGSVAVDDPGAPKPPVSTVHAWLDAIASRHNVDHYVQAVAALSPNAPITP